MLTEIIVTNATLVLDGKTIMPGSRLLIKGEPAKSWAGAVTVGGAVTEQRLVVASPAQPEPEQAEPRRRGRRANTAQDAE